MANFRAILTMSCLVLGLSFGLVPLSLSQAEALDTKTFFNGSTARSVGDEEESGSQTTQGSESQELPAPPAIFLIVFGLAGLAGLRRGTKR